MEIPPEPIGSIPKPLKLIHAIAEFGDFADPQLEPLYEEAIRDRKRTKSYPTSWVTRSKSFEG